MRIRLAGRQKKWPQSSQTWKATLILFFLFLMLHRVVSPRRFELPAYSVGNCRSVLMSYGDIYADAHVI